MVLLQTAGGSIIVDSLTPSLLTVLLCAPPIMLEILVLLPPCSTLEVMFMAVSSTCVREMGLRLVMDGELLETVEILP